MGDVYEAGTFIPGKNAGYLIGRIRTAFLAALDKELAADPQLAPLEVTAAQFIIIARLSLDWANSASDLCKGMSYDPGAMTRMLDRLETRGLIRRTRSPEDRRLINLALTEAGASAAPLMQAAAIRVLNRFLRGFTKTEARQLEGYLERMLENAPAE